jgi:FAD/FMN-containing dehydrogenase
MATYETIVDATLAHGLMPLVVPQLKTITLGGAVTGLGIESSSWKHGLPHESVLEMDILTGDGRVVTATPTNEHADLFRGFANSYGTLGYALRLKVELIPVKRYVALRHVRFHDAISALNGIARACDEGEVDFVDGVWFSPTEVYVTLGVFTDERPQAPSDYTGMEVYYRSIRERERDLLTVRDYIWRWDTDWFWCSRALGVQNPRIRRWIPRRYLRSDTYWKLIALDRRVGYSAWRNKRDGRPQEAVIQDVEIPLERTAEFLDFLDERTGIEPVWLCPVELRSADPWPLYPMSPDGLFVNVGFWSSATIRDGEADGDHNRAIEAKVSELGGSKSLYSSSYYTPEEFWTHYNGDEYQRLKKAYDGEGRLLDLYDKCVKGR